MQYAPLVQRALAPFAKDFTWPEELPALPFPETVPGIVLRRRQVPHEIRDNEGLTDEQIRAVCPAAFAEKAHDSRSGAYLFIPTSQIIGGLREVGYMPTYAAQSTPRIKGREDFTKHLVRFRHKSFLGKEIPEARR